MDGPQVADGTSYSPSQAKPPKFLEAPKDKTAEEGKQCRVSCEIDGIPPPAVTWYVWSCVGTLFTLQL